MKRLATLTAVLFLAFGLTVPMGAQAQTDIKIGPRVGLPVGDLADASTVFFGAEGRVDSEALPVVANVSFDYYVTDVDGVSYFTVDLNGLYEFGVEDQPFAPYAGGGLGITRSSVEVSNQFGSVSASDTDIGLNLVGGARFSAGSVDPFAQVNATIGDATRIGITGGILFGL